MNTKPVTLRLVLSVTFFPNGESVESLRARLMDIAETAANRGGMTGDGPAEVDGWKAEVEDVTGEAEESAPRTLHMLAKNGLFYRAGNWCEDSGELFDLANPEGERAAMLLVEQHGGRFFPVENCVRD